MSAYVTTYAAEMSGWKPRCHGMGAHARVARTWLLSARRRMMGIFTASSSTRMTAVTAPPVTYSKMDKASFKGWMSNETCVAGSFLVRSCFRYAGVATAQTP